MFRRILFVALMVSGSCWALQAQNPDPNADPNAGGAEPLTRGPIHEAFAEPFTTVPPPSPIVPKQPPAPIEELPPDVKPEGQNVVWIPGYFAWDDERADFIWISGFWRDVPPDRTWMPGYWNQAQGGFQWVAGYWASTAQQNTDYLPPPPAPIESGPSIPAPVATSTYVPGTWIFRDTRYYWRPGFWVGQQPGWIFSPARYYWTPSGYVFCDGYWDYPLQNRGLLFAPIASGWGQPNWVYQPTYAIPVSNLLAALFARPNDGHYYFGDYFAPGYARSGFTPWYAYHPARNVPSPLFAYYQHSEKPTWVTSLQRGYVDRREGKTLRPAESWNQQRQLIENIHQNKALTVNNNVFKVENREHLADHLTMIAPVDKLPGKVALVKLDRQQIEANREHVAAIRNVAIERRDHDVKLLEKRATTEGAIRSQVKLSRPVVPPAAERVAPKIEIPAHPKLPEHVNKPVAPARTVAEPPRHTTTPMQRPEPFGHPETKIEPKRTEPRIEPKTPVIEPKRIDPRIEPKTPPKLEPKTPVIEPKTPPKLEPKTPVIEPKRVEPKTPPKLEPKKTAHLVAPEVEELAALPIVARSPQIAPRLATLARRKE